MRKLGIVVMVVLALTLAACSPTRTVTPGPGPVHQTKPILAVDLSASPAGWVPVDLGDAQLSVPSTWWVSYGTTPCGTTPPGLLDVQLPNGPAWCSGAVSPKSVVTLNQEVGTHLPPSPSLEINRIPLYVLSRGKHASTVQYLAPTLGVAITTTGPVARGVLDTLSASPRGAVLSQIGHGSLATPRSWRWHTFAGVRFATPARWPTQRSSVAVACRSYVALGERELVRYSATKQVVLPDKPVVELDTDLTAYDGTCPPGSYQESAPGDGVEIDVGTPKVPNAWPLPVDHQLMLRGVKAYVNALQNFDVLSLLVVVPGRAMPLDIWVGLAGNGTVAKTILYSLRAA